MSLTFGDIPYTGLAPSRLTMPTHQYPGIHRRGQQPPLYDHHQHIDRTPTGPVSASASTTLVGDEEERQEQTPAPFFLRCYHTPNLNLSELNDLRIHETQKAIETLQWLGYVLQPWTAFSVNGEETRSLSFFRYDTDPNERMLALIETVHQVSGQVEECFEEPSAGREDVMAWKEEVYKGGWEVVRALEGVLERFR